MLTPHYSAPGIVGIELNPEYLDITYSRARKYYPLLIGNSLDRIAM